MSRYNVNAVVLKNFNYKDSDKIYTLLTDNKGKITANARGVRKISSRRAGSLDTLNYVTAGISENQAGYKTLTEVKLIESYENLKISLDKAKLAYYIIELVHRFIHEDQEQVKIFNLLLKTLRKLNSASSLINASIIVNSFELRFMSLLGYELTLDQCAVSGEKFSLEWSGYRFNLSQGGLTSSAHDMLGRPISKETAYVLNYINAHNKGLVDKPSIKFTKDDVDKADDLIKHYIKEMLEDSFRTTRVFTGV